MRRKLFAAIAGATLLVILSGCSLFTPTPVPTSTATNTPVEKTVPVTSTKQYIDAFTWMADKVTGGTANASRDEVLAAAGTSRSYVLASLENPYLIAGWWETKDDFLMSGVEDVTKYLSGDGKTQFEANVKNLNYGTTDEETAARDNLSKLVFFPSTNLDFTLDPSCYNDWEMGACRFKEVAISNVNYSDGENGLINVSLDATVTPLYNAPDGVVQEPRTYSYTFGLKLTNPPTSITTELPIYTIETISSSLVIKQAEKLF